MSSLIGSLNGLRPYVLALVRIVAALLFLEHGTQKLFGFPMRPGGGDGPALFSLGGIAGIIEIVTGVLIAIGLYTRQSAFLASGLMAFAYWIAHAPRSPFPVLNGGDGAVLFCFLFLYFVFSGPGALALDNRRGR